LVRDDQSLITGICNLLLSKSGGQIKRSAAMDNLIRMVNRSAQGVMLVLLVAWLFTHFVLA